MSNQSLGNALSQRFKQEADIRHIAHHLFRGASVYGVEIAHRGGEEDVVDTKLQIRNLVRGEWRFCRLVGGKSHFYTLVSDLFGKSFQVILYFFSTIIKKPGFSRNTPAPLPTCDHDGGCEQCKYTINSLKTNI